jgi:hypothetical protein
VTLLAACSSPNPNYVGDGPAREGSVSAEAGRDLPGPRDGASEDAPGVDARRDGPRPSDTRSPDTRSPDGPLAPDTRPPDGPLAPDTRPPDGPLAPDTRPPDTRPPDTRPPDGPPVVGCGALEPIASGTAGESSSAHIALDPQGVPHVGFITGNTIRHAVRNAGAWTVATVATANDPQSVRVGVFAPSSSLQHLEVVYDSVTSNTRRVYHRWRASTAAAWGGPASVDNNLEADDLDLASSTTLRIVGSGNLTIGPGLFQAYRVWNATWVNATSSYGYPTSYTHNNGATNVRYARVAAGPTHWASTAFLGGTAPTWQVRREPVGGAAGATIAVPATGFIQAPAAVTVDGSGGVHLAVVGQNFPAPANAGLYYASWSGGAAPTPQLLGDATYARLAVDIGHDGSNPHVVFVEVGSGGGAKWRRRQAGVWAAPVSVLAGGVVGTRLAVDGTKHVAHFVLEAYAGGQYAVSYRACSF